MWCLHWSLRILLSFLPLNLCVCRRIAFLLQLFHEGGIYMLMVIVVRFSTREDHEFPRNEWLYWFIEYLSVNLHVWLLFPPVIIKMRVFVKVFMDSRGIAQKDIIGRVFWWNWLDNILIYTLKRGLPEAVAPVWLRVRLNEYRNLMWSKLLHLSGFRALAPAELWTRGFITILRHFLIALAGPFYCKTGCLLLYLSDAAFFLFG